MLPEAIFAQLEDGEAARADDQTCKGIEPLRLGRPAPVVVEAESRRVSDVQAHEVFEADTPRGNPRDNVRRKG